MTEFAHVSAQFAAARNVDELFTRSMLSMRQLLGADRATLFLVDAEAGVIWSKVADFTDTITVPMGTGMVGAAATSKRVVNVKNAYVSAIVACGMCALPAVLTATEITS